MTLFRISGLVLIALPILFNVTFFALARIFEYPDILRKPTKHILTQFAAGGKRLVLLWYAFAMTALLAVPMALLLAAVFNPVNPILAAVSAILGSLSGLVQALGLFRWTFIVPMLATEYAQAAANGGRRDAIEVVFRAFHQYLGVAVGEHLGYLFTASWSVVISVLMLSSSLFSPLLAVLGIVASVGILAGLLEPAGWKPAGAINALSYLVWSLWLILAGITLVLA